jgi:hypothetical protein
MRPMARLQKKRAIEARRYPRLKRASLGAMAFAALIVSGCCEEVQFFSLEAAPDQDETVRCEDLMGAAFLSAHEFAELTACSHSPDDGWRLLALESQNLKDVPAVPGTARRWTGLMFQAARTELSELRWTLGRLTLADPLDGPSAPSCGMDASLEVPNTALILPDIFERIPSVAVDTSVTLRATHACVAGGTCGRAVVTLHTITGPKHYLYAADGTFLGSGAGETDCD